MPPRKSTPKPPSNDPDATVAVAMVNAGNPNHAIGYRFVGTLPRLVIGTLFGIGFVLHGSVPMRSIATMVSMMANR